MWLLFWNFDNNNRDDDDENDDIVIEISLSYQLALFYILSLESREKYKHFYCHSFFISSQQWKCTTIGRSCPNKGTSTRPKRCTWGIPIQLKILRFRSSAAVVWDEWHLEDSSVYWGYGWGLLWCHAVMLEMRRSAVIMPCCQTDETHELCHTMQSVVKYQMVVFTLVCLLLWLLLFICRISLSVMCVYACVCLIACVHTRTWCVCVCVWLCVWKIPPPHTHTPGNTLIVTVIGNHLHILNTACD